MKKDLSEMVLPKDEEGNLPFGDMKKIGIFIDTTASGKTGSSLYHFLLKAYAGKNIEITEPNLTRTKFKESDTIEKYWVKAKK